VEYAEKVSLGLDLKILVLTVAKAWRARGGQGEHPGFFKGES
jgi:lipopolysaccharide/colanic/teichoic acid biosynthesis glycosyltransferase